MSLDKSVRDRACSTRSATLARCRALRNCHAVASNAKPITSRKHIQPDTNHTSNAPDTRSLVSVTVPAIIPASRPNGINANESSMTANTKPFSGFSHCGTVSLNQLRYSIYANIHVGMVSLPYPISKRNRPVIRIALNSYSYPFASATPGLILSRPVTALAKPGAASQLGLAHGLPLSPACGPSRRTGCRISRR